MMLLDHLLLRSVNAPKMRTRPAAASKTMITTELLSEKKAAEEDDDDVELREDK
jgi:hypothetical protein